MARLSPQQASDKWKNNLSGATQNILTGIQQTTADPPRLALAASQKWQTNVSQALSKYEAGLGRVSQADWKAAATAGVNRVADGAQKKQQKYTDFAMDFFPYQDQGVAQVKGMPSITFQDRVQRAVAMMNHNHGYRRSR